MSIYPKTSFVKALLLCIGMAVSSLTTAQIDPSEGTAFRAAPETVQSKTFNVFGGGDYGWSVSANSTGMPTGGFPTSNSVTLHYAPTASSAVCPATNTYTLTATSVDDGSTRTLSINACRQNTDPVGGRPIEIVMVVDVSGSMGDFAVCACNADPSDSPCDPRASSRTKMDYLKEKLLVTYNSLKDYMESDASNKLGLVAFETTIVSPNPIDPPLSFRTDGGVLDEKMTMLMGSGAGSLQPLGATGMGAGLLEAQSLFSVTGNPIKIILLFTNGMQNMDPMVGFSGGQVTVGGAAFPNDIKIIPYAIFSPEESYTNLLRSIAEANGTDNNELHVSPYVCNVSQPLRQNWVNAVEALGSPKLVHFKTGSLSGMNGQEQFSITENMDRLSVTVSSVGTHNYTNLKIEKMEGGVPVDITPFGAFTPPLSVPSQHRVFSVTFPVGAIVSTEGDYRASFTADQSGIAYDLSVIVDDRGLKQHFFASPVVAAGEPLFLGARLRQSGNAVTDANVKAILYAPKKRLGNGFARQSVPSQFIRVKGPWGPFFPKRGYQAGTMDASGAYQYKKGEAYIKQITITHPTLHSFKTEGDHMKNGEKKYLVVFNETAFSKVYEQEIIATIPLTHEGDGLYRAQYNGTKKTGVYHVRFEATGTHPQIGKYLRREEETPYVRFGTPDRRASCLFMLYDEPPVVLMKPIDEQGNALGPNQISAISIEISSGTAGPLTDYLDGRYVFRVTPAATEPDPTLTIRIHHRLLYHGPLSGIRSKRAFVSLHGGFTFPKNTFDNTHGQGYYGEIKLGYRVYKQFGLQIKGGFYTFHDNETGKKDFTMTGLGAGITYRQWLNLFTGVFLQGEVNAAFYKPGTADWKFGYNGELSLVKPLNHFLNLSFGTGYHIVQTAPDHTPFMTTGLGLQLRF